MSGYRRFLNLRLGATLAVLAGLALIAGACGGDDEAAAPTQPPQATQAPAATATPEPDKLPGEGVKLIFGDLNWDSAQLQTRIAQFIAEHGYGYETDEVFGDTISLFNGLQQGDVDIEMEVWLPNQQEAWDKAIAKDAIVPVGKSLEDNWQSMFVIPAYLQEENPGLKSVDDLPEYKDLFSTAATGKKARLVTCIPGWECEKINAQKIEAYGLGEHVELVSPGSGAGLFSDLEGAYTKRQPWLGYLWGPTKPAAEFDLVQLEEPAYSDACWEADKGCAYPTSEVLIAVNPSVPDKAPEFMDVLNKWDFEASAQVAAEGYMSENDATVEEAAIWYLENQKDVWKQWVTPDAAERVEAALASQ